MRKQILVIGPGMEIGGVERSLLGLLDAINYEQFDVDLFLFTHRGELMPYINSNVKLLPENHQLSMVNEPIRTLLQSGQIKMFSIRMFCKLYGDTKARIKKTSTSSITLCKKIIAKQIAPISKHYDFALGFFGPHYILTNKVSADIKIGWSHTDYTNFNEKPDLKFITPMWSKLDYIACVSEAAETSFQNVFPSLAQKTMVIENIISPSLVRKQAEKFTVYEFGNDKSFKILSVGRFCNAKNFDQVPEICRKLLDYGYDVKWFLIGFGPDEKLIRSRIQEFNVQENVKILGKKINPYPYIKACDLYVQPSRYEGKAITVTEAMILNKPVLITRYTTSSDQLEDGVDGWICDLSVDGVTKGISYLIDHSEIRDVLVQGTKKKNYDQSRELNKIWSLGDNLSLG